VNKARDQLIHFMFFATIVIAFGSSADAQQPKKVHRIGFITATSLSAVSARIEAFRQGLRELGYVEERT
jgi:putative ABC transport system substrate-binding protein